MKKSLFLIAIIGFIAIFSLNLFAQGETVEPCTPDCPDDEWSNVVTIDFHGVGAMCWQSVSFVWRISCGGYQDIQIVGIGEPIYGHKCPYPHLQYTPTQEETFLAAMRAILAANPMQFLPLEGTEGCNTSWRVANRSCWANFEIIVYDMTTGEEVDRFTYYVPCEDSDCCLSIVEVCRDESGMMSIRTLSNSTSALNCNEYVYINEGTVLPCVANCNWVPDDLYEFDPTDPFFTGSVKAVTPLIEKNNNIKLGVNTFVDNSNIQFQLYSQDIDNLSIELYDLNGNKLYTKEVNVNDGINNIYIDRNNVAGTAVVLYSIITNNNTITTGKILNLK